MWAALCARSRPATLRRYTYLTTSPGSWASMLSTTRQVRENRRVERLGVRPERRVGDYACTGEGATRPSRRCYRPAAATVVPGPRREPNPRALQRTFGVKYLARGGCLRMRNRLVADSWHVLSFAYDRFLLCDLDDLSVVMQMHAQFCVGWPCCV
jgi:hypothetical protein